MGYLDHSMLVTKSLFGVPLEEGCLEVGRGLVLRVAYGVERTLFVIQ